MLVFAKYIELFLLLLLSIISDHKHYRIKNSIVYPFMAAGILTNLCVSGIRGLAISLLATVAPAFFLFLLYSLKMLGAGDIKLFAAIGSIMGVKFAIYSIMYSFLLGGLIALVIMVFRKNGHERLKYFLRYVKSCFLTMSLLPYTNLKDRSDGAKFRFSYATALGVLAAFIFYL
ncbi:MAG TPA: prepilin peptidase [Clostridiaceae bacterium]|nr:prepilin peptidase [Clostridiaceae bacterium]